MLVAEFVNVNSVITIMETRVSKCSVIPFASCYFENLSQMYKLFFEDTSYRVALHGSGFDHKWNLVCFSPEEFKSEDDFYMEMDDDGDGHMVFIHQFAMATENKQDIRNDIVILHLVECSETGLFYVEVDDKAQELLKDDSTSFSACDATVLVKMTNGYQKLVLSGKVFLERWRATTGKRFVLTYQLSGFHTAMTECELKPFALKTLPAFVLDVWPAGASNWPNISRTWPSEDVVREAGRQNVYSIPVMSMVMNCDVAADNENYSYLWMPDFGDVEAVLTRHLTEFQSQVFHHFRKIYWQKHPFKNRVLFRNLQLKHAFFWTLQESTGTAWKKQDVANCVIEICKTVVSFLEMKHFPHYFMPKFDLFTFDRCGKRSYLASYSDQMTTMYAMIEHCRSVTPSEQRNTNDRLLKRDNYQLERLVQFKLTNVFEQSSSLLLMQLYQKLHTVSTIDESIHRHLDALKYLEEQRSCYSCIMPLCNTMQAWVTASLGVKYLVKMKSSSVISEMGKLREQASECLKKSVGLAPQSEMCSTALALFLFLTDQRAEVVSYLKRKLPANLSTSSRAVTNDYETAKCGIVSDFSKELASRWIESSDNIDFMFSRLEQPILSLLPGLWATIGFTRCPVLGVTSTSSDVFAISSEFLSDILLVLALIAEKRTEEALTIVKNQEQKLLKQIETPVMGDKKLMANFFILAAVYSRLSRKEDALRLLHSSRDIFRNARNPALGKIFQTYASRFKRYMGWAVQGLLLGLIISVCATYFGWFSKQ